MIRWEPTRHMMLLAAAMSLLAGAAWAQGAKPLKECPPDSVVSGRVCMDRYEASVWRVPSATTANRGLVSRIQQGKATAADLTSAGATQLGLAGADYAPCADNGEGCADTVYAVSLPGVLPSASLTWFQAQAACKNARKGLPSNAEWQAAVTGTPNPGPDDGTSDCNTAMLATAAVPTGSRRSCVSTDGASDMVGNLWEWVADWVPRSTACGTWSPSVDVTGDYQCLGGAATTGEPGALFRGGSFGFGKAAGPLAILGGSIAAGPSVVDRIVGFRCAR